MSATVTAPDVRRETSAPEERAVPFHYRQTESFVGLSAVEEIFDVQLLPGLRFPEVVGFHKDSIQHTFIVPPDASCVGD